MSRYYDPCDGTLAVKARWKIADVLNRLSGTCWANIVSWALGSRPLIAFDGEGDVRQDSLCRRDAARCGRCYCGKIARTVTAPGVETAEEVVTCNAYYTDGPSNSEACGLPVDHWPAPHSWEGDDRG